MRIQDVIGQRVREARKAQKWTQERLGKELATYLPGGWKPQVVSQAESGEREFAAAEMVALALVLDKQLSWFYLPREGVEYVEVRSRVVPIGELRNVLIQGAAREVAAAMQSQMAQIEKQVAVISSQVEEVAESVLSDEEEHALRLLAFGHTNAEIAAELGVTEEQVKATMRRILERLGVDSRKRGRTVAEELAFRRSSIETKTPAARVIALLDAEQSEGETTGEKSKRAGKGDR